MLKMIWYGLIYRLKGGWGYINKMFYPQPNIVDMQSSLKIIIKKNVRLHGLEMESST